MSGRFPGLGCCRLVTFAVAGCLALIVGCRLVSSLVGRFADFLLTQEFVKPPSIMNTTQMANHASPARISVPTVTQMPSVTIGWGRHRIFTAGCSHLRFCAVKRAHGWG